MSFFGGNASGFAAMPGTACSVRWRCSARQAGSGGLARAGGAPPRPRTAADARAASAICPRTVARA